jgi:hypothetical protein
MGYPGRERTRKRPASAAGGGAGVAAGAAAGAGSERLAAALEGILQELRRRPSMDMVQAGRAESEQQARA